MAQYIHLLTNSKIGLPTDLWVPSTPHLKPQTSNQVAVGVAQNFRENYEISLEAYYKTMNNVLEYKEGAGFYDLDNTWENKIVQGDGRSYGAELFAQKKTGSFTGWVGYTLSWTDRKFDELNRGKRFFYKYDRRHDISIALMKRFGKRIETSAAWVFGSGNCVTIPIGIYQAEHPMGQNYGYYSQQFEYGDRNGYRMAAYHRLDLSISFVKQRRWGERRWTWSIYNVYNRKNPYFIDVEERWHQKGITYKFVQYSLFPIIPSFSYSFKF
jgi:outer membrane receptor protein involved in Fe transport